MNRVCVLRLLSVAWRVTKGVATVIDRVCMFCKTVYGQKPGDASMGPTHGVCPVCEPYALELLERGCGDGVSVPLSDRGREVAGAVV